MAIDTDDLTDKTYTAILSEAENFNHDLTLQFGLLSYKCSDEKDFINKSRKLIEEMMKCNDGDLNEIFFGNPPDKIGIHTALKKIKHNILMLDGLSSDES